MTPACYLPTGLGFDSRAITDVSAAERALITAGDALRSSEIKATSFKKSQDLAALQIQFDILNAMLKQITDAQSTYTFAETSVAGPEDSERLQFIVQTAEELVTVVGKSFQREEFEPINNDGKGIHMPSNPREPKRRRTKRRPRRSSSLEVQCSDVDPEELEERLREPGTSRQVRFKDDTKSMGSDSGVRMKSGDTKNIDDLDEYVFVSLTRSNATRSKGPRSKISTREMKGKNVKTKVDMDVIQTTHVPSQNPPTASPVHRQDCIVCADDIEVGLNEFLAAPCGHNYCKECTEQFVKAHNEQESLHPLRCCNISIPNQDTEKLLPNWRFVEFRRKCEEYETPHRQRVYCPCNGRFIPLTSPSRVSWFTRRISRKCSSCGSWVCTVCKDYAHSDFAPCKNRDTVRVLKMAKENGWKRCANCRRIVEKTAGCMHMTCLCGYQFCYRCGKKYTGKCRH